MIITTQSLSFLSLKSCAVIGLIILDKLDDRLNLISIGLINMSKMCGSTYWGVIMGANIDLSITIYTATFVLGSGEFTSVEDKMYK